MQLSFTEHLGCVTLLQSVRGTICTHLFTSPPRVFRRGERVFHAGDAAKTLFQVKSGVVQLTTISEAGDEMLLELYHREDVFGEVCFCGQPHTSTASAVEDAEVASAPIELLQTVLRQQPDLAMELLAEFSSRLVAAYANLQNAVFDDVVTRVAARLASLGSRPGAFDGVTEVLHRLPHSELARMLGVQRETVTRAIGELRRRQLVSYTPDGRLRLDLARLQEYVASTTRTR